MHPLLLVVGVPIGLLLLVVVTGLVLLEMQSRRR